MLAHALRRIALAPRPLAPRPLAPIATGARRLATSTSPTTELLDPSTWTQNFDMDAARVELQKIRDIENDLKASMDIKTTPIDWEHWQSEISYPGLVDELKAALETVPVPNVEEEFAKISKEIDSTFDPIIAQCDSLANEAASETAELEARISEIKYMSDNIEEMPIDEFLERNPGFKKAIEEDIENHRWFGEDEEA